MAHFYRMPIKIIKLLKQGSFKVFGTEEHIKSACIKAIKADKIEGMLATIRFKIFCMLSVEEYKN